mgnify:CR=1 FL=1
MPDIFQRAMAQRVRYPMGVFDHARGQKKTIMAPFRLLKLDDGLYFMPVDAPAFGGSSNTLQGVIGSDTVDEAFYLGRESFYYEETCIVIGEHELGDWKGTPDSWKGMHQLGML